MEREDGSNYDRQRDLYKTWLFRSDQGRFFLDNLHRTHRFQRFFHAMLLPVGVSTVPGTQTDSSLDESRDVAVGDHASSSRYVNVQSQTGVVADVSSRFHPGSDLVVQIGKAESIEAAVAPRLEWWLTPPWES